MNAGRTNRVTSLEFHHYDPSNYILDQSEGMKLSSMNKILLNLFNNDIYAYTVLVGKMKGVWWKYWFADAALKGYAAGDMVCSNGIQEIEFLSSHWKSVKTIADYGMVTNFLPRFSQQDDESVSRYVSALTDYFHLGNRYAERQIYISLKDNNKSAVSITDAWQPYIVTTEELQRREYRLSDILEDEIRTHNAKYHTDLDVLDAADAAYENNETSISIYENDLAEYLPKVRLTNKEHQSWVNFAAVPASNKTLGLGTATFDFIHIVKPLGTNVHHLESWVRTDGHVTIKGYVPVALLTELIPEEGTIEYTKWKMGGTRRYGMRLDYSINDAVSKLYFTGEDDEAGSVVGSLSDVLAGQPMQRAAARMIDDDDDPTASLYSIVSYNPPYSGTVLFHPNACDFPFEDLPNHPDLLKEGDDVILRDLLNADAYTHTFEAVNTESDPAHPSPIDPDIAEAHLFRKKYEAPDVPSNPTPSPIDRAADTSNVASEIRLLRNFGVTRSPALKSVLKAVAFPDVSELMSPALISAPTVLVNEWSWTSGQSIVFEVPTNCQNIQFEVEGMMKENNIDFSLYDIRTSDGNGVKWVYDLVLNYELPKAILTAALAEGFEEEWGICRLVRNMDEMMGRIEHCTLEYPAFTTFMQFRALDIAPLRSLLDQVRSRANGYLREVDPLGTPDFRQEAALLQRLYEYLYAYIVENLRYGAFHDCFAELMSGAVTVEQSHVVLINCLKGFLRKKQITCGTQTEQEAIDQAASEWVAEVKSAIEQAENETTRLVNNGQGELANQISTVVVNLKALHVRYVDRRAVEFRPLTNLPNLDPESTEYQAELKKYRDKYLDNFREIDAYLKEVEESLTAARLLKTKITSYLSVSWLDESVRTYLTYQLSRLNDSMQRYKAMNLNICLGYDEYVLKWTDLFGISLDTALRLGFTVRNLMYGAAPMRSLTTIKAKLQEEA